MKNEEILVEEMFEVEEKSSILTKIIVSPKNFSWINDECLVVVINVENPPFFENLSQIKVCGKTELEWVLLATNGPEQKVLKDVKSEELLQNLKAVVGEKKYLFLTYSDVPFLQHSTFISILDYFSSNGLNALKFERGYVFKTDYLKNLSSLDQMNSKSFSESEFERVDNPNSFSKFFKFISNKIKNYHKKNGVIMLGEESIFIDADVKIECGTIIYPQNVIKGETSIGKNVTLLEGNLIDCSSICDGAMLQNSIIVGSKIDDKKLLSFSKIINGRREQW